MLTKQTVFIIKEGWSKCTALT